MSEKSSKWIIDATDESFEKDVIERSRNSLCIVDFWAEWCATCRTLGPILEELADEYQGKFTLIKVDTESAQKTAEELAIQSIPAVFAFSGGQPVDGFAGVLPKEQIKQWIDSQLKADEIDAAIVLVKSDPEAALGKLEKLAGENPTEPAIPVAMAEANLNMGRDQQALEIINQLEERGFLEPEAERIKARLDLKSKETLDVDELKSKAESEPDNLDIQLEFASALFGHDQFEEGFKVCLEVVRKDKTGAGDKARELMVEVFRSLPNDSELTDEYRRKLSMALY